MYTLTQEQSSKVFGGVCPICLVTATGAAIGASSVTFGITTQYLFLIAAGSLVLSSSMVWAMYHSDIAGLTALL